MRIAGLFLVSCACVVSLALATPSDAQQAAASPPTRTVDDYVCAFTGECAKPANANNSIAAPATKGFRLSVPEQRVAPSSSARGMTTTNVARAPGPVARSQRGTSPRRERALAHSSVIPSRRMDLRVSFLLGSAQLTAHAREEAKVFAKALLLPELADKRFRIGGHTDSSGTRAKNLDLSKRRAQSVADYLASLGVQTDRLEVSGYGPDRPLAGHRPSSPDNRRVEAQLL